MKYEFKRYTPEFKAIAYTLLLVKIALLYLLYHGIVGPKLYVGITVFLLIISLTVSQQSTEIIEEHEVTFHNK